MKLHQILCLLLALALALGLAACTQKPKEPTPAQAAKRDELAQEFMTEIRDDILPLKNQPGMIAAKGILISKEEEVADFALLDAFVDDYEAGVDCSLTACFITKSFVAVRMVMIDGVGYYFRYQYDSRNPIAVSSRVFDNIRITEDDALGKVQLRLEYDGKELVTFTFRKVREDVMPPEPGSKVPS